LQVPRGELCKTVVVLDRIAIRGFKSLHDVELRLAPLVVVFGPNAVGKSNLLEALMLLGRLVTERTVSDALAPPIRGYPLEAFSLPRGGLRDLLEQDAVTLTLEADLRPPTLAGKDEMLRYRAAITTTPRTGEVKVVDEYLTRLDRTGQPRAGFKPRIEKIGDHLVVRQLGEAGTPRHEPTGLNHSIVSNLQYSGDNRFPDLDRLRAELGGWRTYYLDPARAMRVAQPPRETSDIAPSGELIAPFLYRLKGSDKYARHFQAVARALRTVIPNIESLSVDLDPERGTIDLRICQQGTEYSSRVISEGTLRILALCSIAANPWPARLVAFEEPENGVHPRRIEVIAKLLASIPSKEDRQVVVTTHSPTFLSAMLEMQREQPALIKLVRCIQDGRATRVQPFDDPLPLLQNEEVKAALTSNEDLAAETERIISTLLRQGWLDG
jgi:predicted ATPase